MATEQKRRIRNNVDREYWTRGEGLMQVKQWVHEYKMFDKDIAARIGITQKTLIEWKKEFETFGMVFNTYRGVAALNVVNAMYKSAMGYFVSEQTLDALGNKKLIRKYIKPEISAQIFLLKNWLKNEYKDKPEIVVEGNVNVNPASGLTTEQLRDLSALARKELEEAKSND